MVVVGVVVVGVVVVGVVVVGVVVVGVDVGVVPHTVSKSRQQSSLDLQR